MKDFLTQLLLTLNSIEVKGKENLDYLLGCMISVERAIAQLDEETKKEEENDG